MFPNISLVASRARFRVSSVVDLPDIGFHGVRERVHAREWR